MEKKAAQTPNSSREPVANDFSAQKKRTMLRLVKKLAVSDNAFLKEFAEFLKITYQGDEPVYFKEKSWNTNVENIFHQAELEKRIRYALLFPNDVLKITNAVY